jgi:hypothetical protein
VHVPVAAEEHGEEPAGLLRAEPEDRLGNVLLAGALAPESVAAAQLRDRIGARPPAVVAECRRAVAGSGHVEPHADRLSGGGDL